jgi:N-acyl homoserine lactone hydrolase
MIHPLLLSEVTLPPGHPRAGGGPYPVYGFVIVHPEGPILVDTGVGGGHPELEAGYRPVHHDLAAALDRVGVGVGDVATVINTHLHFDHCGGNLRFPGVPLIAQERELAAATEAGHTVPEWVWFPGADWRPVDGEAEIAAGVRVIPTPGHSVAHQSVVVDRDGQVEVIAGQVVHDPGELDAGASMEPLDAENAAAVAVSARRITALRPDRVWFSHCEEVWQRPPDR